MRGENERKSATNREWCKFVLIIFVHFYLFDNSHLLPLSISAASRCCCHILPLQSCIICAFQDTVSAATIPHRIFLVGHFFVGKSFARDGDVSIGDVIAVPLGGTPPTFSCPIRPHFSSCVSTATVIIVLHIFCRLHPPLSPSSHVSFVVPIVPPLFRISADSVLIITHICFHIHCFPYPPFM